jgi:Zn-dependent protease with chaperone function
MFVSIFNHFRLTWRLVWDRRIKLWLKLFLIGIPGAYALIPLPEDILPVVGALDDLLFLGVSSLIFVAMCPPSLVAEHRAAMLRLAPGAYAALDACRHPEETRHLASGFAIMFAGLALIGWLGGLISFGLFLLGYFYTSLSRRSYLSNALQVTPRQLPELYASLQAAQASLPAVKANLFVSQNPTLNAFTFGYQEPYTVVLTSGLVEKLTPAEIQAVIGHELGHVLFGHVRLVNMMGGMGGPLRLLFNRWSRSCEYSADAIALKASQGQPAPVISALLKLTSGLANLPVDLQSFLEQDGQDSSKAAGWAETLNTHPFVDKRIRRLLGLQGS